MFKNAERIGKTIEQLIKVAEEIKNEERKQELITVIHGLAKVHQNVLGDLTQHQQNHSKIMVK